MKNSQTGLDITVTEGFVEVLDSIKASIVVSTYQAGVVLFLGCVDKELFQYPLSFKKPMGIAVDNQRGLAINTKVVLDYTDQATDGDSANEAQAQRTTLKEFVNTPNDTLDIISLSGSSLVIKNGPYNGSASRTFSK